MTDKEFLQEATIAAIQGLCANSYITQLLVETGGNIEPPVAMSAVAIAKHALHQINTANAPD